ATKAGDGTASSLSASAAAFTPGGESSGTYMEVSATAPPPMDAGEPAADGGEGNVLTSILFGSGKDGE
ncbi:unnamed protein product, partial [Ectocarpus sp. 13 AM-2016]